MPRRSISRSSVCLSLTLIAMISACSPFSPKSLGMVGKQAPYTRLTLLDGRYIPIAQYKDQGKTLILAFWDTTCPFSRPQISDLNEYAKAASARKDVAFIVVSVDNPERESRVREMAQSDEYNALTHAFSGNEVYDEAFIAFDYEIVPVVVVIGPDGVIKEIGQDADIVAKHLGLED